MKAIKGLVIFMGVLLLSGLGLLGYGLYSKTGIKAKSTSAPVVSASADFGAVPVPVAAGSRIEQVLVVGERVVLRVTGAGPERLIVLDPASGSLSGSFVMTPEAPGGTR